MSGTETQQITQEMSNLQTTGNKTLEFYLRRGMLANCFFPSYVKI